MHDKNSKFYKSLDIYEIANGKYPNLLTLTIASMGLKSLSPLKIDKLEILRSSKN